MRATIGALVLATTLLSAPAGAQAERRTSSLGWSRLEGAAGCIGPGELARAVETLLGRTVFVSASEAELSVEGHVAPVGAGGWKAVIVVSDKAGAILGKRQLDTKGECRELDEPVALAIALMIDPDAALGAKPPPATKPPPPPVPPPPAPPPTVIVKEKRVYVPVPAPAPAPTKTEEPWRVALRGGPLLGVGLLPSAAPGLHGAVSVEPPWFVALEGSAAIYLPTGAEGGGASGDFQVAYVGVSLCPLTKRYAPWTLSICAGGQLGRLWADGTDGSGKPWESGQFVANVFARGRVGYRIVGPVGASVGLTGAVVLLRDPFTVQDATGQARELFRPSPVAFLPDVAMNLDFP